MKFTFGVRKTLGIAAVFLSACFMLPFDLVMAPKRELKIVNDVGLAVPKALVRQIWDQYSLGIRDEEDFQTDSHGKVTLPNREVRTALVWLATGALKQFKELGIHASYGTHETIAIFAKDHGNKWIYDRAGLPNTGVIILERRLGAPTFQ